MSEVDINDVRAGIFELERVVNENELDDIVRYSHLKYIVELRIIENTMMKNG